jgi:hypothetical protein
MMLAACSACSACSGDAASSPSSSTSAPAKNAIAQREASPSLSRDDLIGTWRPVLLFGRDVHRVRINGSPLTVRFQRTPQRGWTGYDGCNWTSGPFHVGRSAAFSATARTTTAIGCLPRRRGWSSNVTVMTRAGRVAVSAGRLSVYGPNGRRIGVYFRTT